MSLKVQGQHGLGWREISGKWKREDKELRSVNPWAACYGVGRGSGSQCG